MIIYLRRSHYLAIEFSAFFAESLETGSAIFLHKSIVVELSNHMSVAIGPGLFFGRKLNVVLFWTASGDGALLISLALFSP